MKFGAGAGEDPFAKVKDLITELTKRQQAEISSEATHTWYCDAELSETTEKKQDLESVVEKHSSKLEAVVAKSNILDGEISALEAELGALSRSQLQMDTMRAEERKIFAKAKEDFELGISGVQKALRQSLACSRWSRVISPRTWRNFLSRGTRGGG